MTQPLDPWLLEILPRAENLPSLPLVALEVLRLCRAEDTTLDDLARTLSRDPALAARLLRFANSSLYGSGEEVRTLQRATLVLGMKTVQLMSLSFSLASAVPRAGRDGSFDYELYWRRSLVRAVAARALAGQVGLHAQDEAFLTGLLCEIGQVVLARCSAGGYEKVLRAAAARKLGWPAAELEREFLGFDHSEVGAALVRSWQLPRYIELALSHRLRPEDLPRAEPAELATLVRVLAVASHVTDLFTLDEGARALELGQAQARRHFELGEAQLAAFLGALEQALRETAAMLEVALPAGRTHEAILAEARAELLQRSLGQARELESLRAAVDPVQRARLLAEPRHVDELTGGANAAAFASVLELEVRARLDAHLARPLGIVLLEIDRFDELPGEAARTEAQRGMAELVARLVRRSDLCARTGPGGFALLLGDGTPPGVRTLAERIRHELQLQELVVADRPLHLSVSIGAACLGSVRAPSDGLALREVALRLLVRARQRGRGRTEVHGRLIQPG